MRKKLLKNTVYLLLRNNMENYDDNRVENFNSIYKKLIDLEGSNSDRLDKIEEQLDTIVKKFLPMMDLLETVVSTNMSKKLSPNEKEFGGLKSSEIEKYTPDLAFKEENGSIYIYGKKTFDNKSKIKENFNGSSWNKEKSAWTFRSFPGFEEKLTDIFPHIIKDQ